MIFRDFSDFSIAGNNWKKKNLIIMKNEKKNWCRNLEICYCMICIVRLYCGEQWQRQGAGLGIRRAQGRWARHQARRARQQARTGALGHRRACWGAGPCSGRWGVRQSAGRVGVARTGALQAGGRAGKRQAPWARRRAAGARALAGARACGRAAARRRRAAGRWARGARGRQALGARGARGLGAWAGLGQCTRCTRPIFDPF